MLEPLPTTSAGKREREGMAQTEDCSAPSRISQGTSVDLLLHLVRIGQEFLKLNEETKTGIQPDPISLIFLGNQAKTDAENLFTRAFSHSFI